MTRQNEWRVKNSTEYKQRFLVPWPLLILEDKYGSNLCWGSCKCKLSHKAIAPFPCSFLNEEAHLGRGKPTFVISTAVAVACRLPVFTEIRFASKLLCFCAKAREFR
ncbi:hypothetical protein ACJJTC_010216 [Scirpophaga incertulas]